MKTILLLLGKSLLTSYNWIKTFQRSSVSHRYDRSSTNMKTSMKRKSKPLSVSSRLPGLLFLHQFRHTRTSVRALGPIHSHFSSPVTGTMASYLLLDQTGRPRFSQLLDQRLLRRLTPHQLTATVLSTDQVRSEQKQRAQYILQSTEIVGGMAAQTNPRFGFESRQVNAVRTRNNETS